MWYNILQVHKMFLFLNSLGCTNYQTLLAMISLLSYGNPDPFWGCIGKLAKQVEGEHTTFYGLFWLAAKWMSDGWVLWLHDFLNLIHKLLHLEILLNMHDSFLWDAGHGLIPTNEHLNSAHLKAQQQ
jgi:hypothetical protein